MTPTQQDHTTATPYWAVAGIQTSRSDLVEKLLRREGFETYAPKVRESRKRISPLFPGYVLVRIVVRWYPVRWTPGVLRVLMDGERPARLADQVVIDLKSREVRGFFKMPRDPKLPLKGDKVRVLTGTFAGHVGLYEGMSGAARERVLLDWLGQKVPVIMPVGNVEMVL